jgi:outer membrane receptor for ferric coprogen and ferric-rhodotorulic acid
MYSEIKYPGAEMSVVSLPHIELVRSRKTLEKAYLQQDWDSLREIDSRLGAALNNAFEDEQRDTVELVHEMERILSLYAEIVASMPKNASAALSSFPRLHS